METCKEGKILSGFQIRDPVHWGNKVTVAGGSMVAGVYGIILTVRKQRPNGWNWTVNLRSCFPSTNLLLSRLHVSKQCSCLGLSVHIDEPMGASPIKTVEHPTWKSDLVWA